MDKAITTALMVITGMITVTLLFNAVYPAVLDGSDAMSNMQSRLDERLTSQVEIVHAAAELDSSGLWQDTNGDGHFSVFIWVKNVGSNRIIPIEGTDLFFGPEGNFGRIPHQSEAGGSFPYWDYDVENATEWTPTATLKITIHYSSVQAAGRYFVKVAAPNGISDETYLSM
ncbi:MAG: hypothetical protein AB1791_03060 [Chloroflexota bacterium]